MAQDTTRIPGMEIRRKQNDGLTAIEVLVDMGVSRSLRILPNRPRGTPLEKKYTKLDDLSISIFDLLCFSKYQNRVDND